MANLNKTEAYRQFRATLTNPQWSWSAKADDAVVLTMWADRFARKDGRLMIYNGAHEPGDEHTLGNNERLQHLVWARDHCDGRVLVVMATVGEASNPRREIKDVYPRPDLIGKLTYFDEATGEFTVEIVTKS